MSLSTFFLSTFFESMFFINQCLSMSTSFTLDVFSNRRFLLFNVFSHSMFFYILLFFQSTFFTFRHFVPVDAFYLLCLVPVGVLSFDVLSHSVFLFRCSVCRHYLPSVFFTSDVLSVNRPVRHKYCTFPEWSRKIMLRRVPPSILQIRSPF